MPHVADPDAPWAQRVARSLAAMGMRREDLARALTDPRDPSRHVGVSTLRTWLNGTTEPPRERVSQIARLLEIDEALLYADLGWLDAHQLVAARDGVGAAQRALELLHSPVGQLQAGAHGVVQRALDLGHDVFCWTRTWSPADAELHQGDDEDGDADDDGSGRRAAEPLRQYVGVTADRAAPRTGWLKAAQQAALTDQYETAVRIAPALVEDRPLELATCQERHPAQLWFWVPLLLAAHPPGRPPEPALAGLRDAHDVVVVVGPRGSGVDAVGAWLARDAGFGFISTSLEAQRVFGRPFPPSERQRFLHARQALWVGTAAVRSPRWHGYVVAHSATQSAHDLVHDLHVKCAGSRVLVVLLRAGAELGAYVADHFPHDADSQAERPGRSRWAGNRDALLAAVAEVRRATEAGGHPGGAQRVDVVEARLDATALPRLAEVPRLSTTGAATGTTPSDALLAAARRTYLGLRRELAGRASS